MKKTFILLLILELLFSCNTQIKQEYHCNVEFGIDKTNEGSVIVNFVKKNFYKNFEYYVYRIEECPGPISTNCMRYYTFYDPKPSLYLDKDVIASNECFVLGEKQKYIFPIFNSDSFKAFTSGVTDEKVKSELIQIINNKTHIDSLRNDVRRIDKKRKKELLKVSVEDVYVYEFEINIEQLNYYIRPNGLIGTIYTHSAFPAQRAKVLVLTQGE